MVFSGSLDKAAPLSTTLGPGSVYAIGCRTGSRAVQTALRSNQRFLPLTEVDPVVATRTALAESEDAPLWVSLHLDVLATHFVPGVELMAMGGVDLSALRAAIEVIPGERVVGFEILDYPEPPHRDPLTALTAAELLRDNILTWWPPEKIHV